MWGMWGMYSEVKNPKLQTRNSKLETPNSKLQTNKPRKPLIPLQSFNPSILQSFNPSILENQYSAWKKQALID
jgi:hypothetical protein